MAEIIERKVGDLTLRIDGSLCVGFAQCVDEAEEAFELDDEETVQFAAPDQVSRETLLSACKVCPVEALQAFDAHGNRLVP